MYMNLTRRAALHKSLTAALFVGLQFGWATPASAQAPTPDVPPTSPPPTAPPVGVSGSLSNSLVLRGNPAQSTLLTVLSGSYQWTSAFSTFGRVGTVSNSSSDEANAIGAANPALGVSLQFAIGKHIKVGGLSGITIPIGSGGGNSPSPAAFRAWTNSVDWGGAMFAVNHVDIFNGVRGAYTLGDLTLSFETTLHELIRVRGESVDPIGAAASVTGTTATVSYALLPQLLLSTAISETRFWNTPIYIQQSPDSRVDYFFSAGASTTIKIGNFEVDPGLVYARALDLPLTKENFQVVELDLGFSL
jgi:hypothetical protein